MKFAVLGTGMVGTALGSKLVALGHEARMGSRSATNEKAKAWATGAGPRASYGSYGDAAGFGEIIVNATSGTSSLAALRAAGEMRLAGKILIDVANPLETGKGIPTLSVVNGDSLGEQIQRAFPRAKVVKTLNTLSCALMVDPAQLAGGEHDVFVSGDDADAKARVTELLRSFGWKHVIDLGGIETARGTEMYLAMWLRLYGALKTDRFNVHLVR